MICSILHSAHPDSAHLFTNTNIWMISRTRTTKPFGSHNVYLFRGSRVLNHFGWLVNKAKGVCTMLSIFSPKRLSKPLTSTNSIWPSVASLKHLKLAFSHLKIWWLEDDPFLFWGGSVLFSGFQGKGIWTSKSSAPGCLTWETPHPSTAIAAKSIAIWSHKAEAFTEGDDTWNPCPSMLELVGGFILETRNKWVPKFFNQFEVRKKGGFDRWEL